MPSEIMGFYHFDCRSTIRACAAPHLRIMRSLIGGVRKRTRKVETMPRARGLVLSVTAVAAIMLVAGYRVHATGNGDWDHDDGQDPRIAQGFKIAPVPLTYDRDDREQRELVGLGS